MAMIEYQVVSPGEVNEGELMDFYQRQCQLPAGSVEKLRRMVECSCCFVTARDGGRLIGVARGVTDGLRGYLAECKLDPAYQGPAAVTRTDGRIEHDERGIGREMAMRVLETLRDLGVERIDVTAHGTEEDFCTELGFRKVRGAVAMHLDPRTLAVCQTTGV
jgi:predicted N-acetyltransferase YhbS